MHAHSAHGIVRELGRKTFFAALRAMPAIRIGIASSCLVLGKSASEIAARCAARVTSTAAKVRSVAFGNFAALR